MRTWYYDLRLPHIFRDTSGTHARSDTDYAVAPSDTEYATNVSWRHTSLPRQQHNRRCPAAATKVLQKRTGTFQGGIRQSDTYQQMMPSGIFQL